MRPTSSNRPIHPSFRWSSGAQAPQWTTAGPSVAEGDVKIGGFLADGVTVDLTFNNGAQRTFKGVIFGVAGGFTEGAGAYCGSVPNDGEQWHVSIYGLDVGVGGVMVNFTSAQGATEGYLACTTAGAFAAGAGGLSYNTGSGAWKKG